MAPKLEVGDTLGEVFRVYREQAGLLLPLAFWLFLVVAIVDAIVGDDLSLFWIGLIVSTLVGTLYQGMVVGLVGDIQDGRRDWSAGELARSVLPVLGPLVAAGILAAIGIAIGLILLVAPGLYLLTIWAVIAPAIVIERRGALEAFGRSRSLVRDHGWQVFGVVVVGGLIALVTAIVAAQIAEAIAEGPILRAVLTALASTLTAPVEGLIAAVLYFRLRELKGEGRTASPPESPNIGP
ncbi:MAG TPA: hypothetical protein VFJ99_00120 [Solirubrobacterales bacterium]|nr:hypothetical protein [Solirubrobacterales bacterium]